LSGFFHRNHVAIESASKVIERLAIEDEERKSRLKTLQETYKKDPKVVSGSIRLLTVLKHTMNADLSASALEIIKCISQIIINKKRADREEAVGFVNLVVEQLTNEFSFKTMKDTCEMYVFDELRGVYNRFGEVVIKEQSEILCPEISTHKVNEIIEKLRRRTFVDRSKFDKDHDILNIQNGLVNIRTGEFIEGHNPDHLSLIQLPVKYNPVAYPRKILDFMYNVLHPGDVPLMIEYIAYCLIGDTKLQKDLMCVGEEDSGKSVMLKLITRFLGPENISSRTLHDLVTDRFAKADLFGKLANVFADISSKKLGEIETFKVLATGDRISAQHKFKDSFEFEPNAKLIFSANTPPKPPEDVDNSYYRRWILIPFYLRKKCFFCNKQIMKDPDLLEKLTTEEELSGLLNLVLKAARRLLEKRKFVKSPSTEEIRERYQRLADPVKAWLDDNCVLGPQYEGDKNELHTDFIEFCWKKKLNRLEINSLGRELSKHGVHDKRKGSEREHVWSGITLRSKLKEEGQESLSDRR
jgi:P4 family phage/plasmid primase-like protien